MSLYHKFVPPHLVTDAMASRIFLEISYDIDRSLISNKQKLMSNKTSKTDHKKPSHNKCTYEISLLTLPNKSSLSLMVEMLAEVLVNS